MTDSLHTVALTVPGTQTRVLVERLLGTQAEAIGLAREALGEIVSCRQQMVAQVVRSDEVTDLPLSPLETT
ncbi:MAG: hypothetical protein ABL916_23985 [Burkholderiaceae bacterium]